MQENMSKSILIFVEDKRNSLGQERDDTEEKRNDYARKIKQDPNKN